MSRWTKSLFAIATLAAAAGMLAVAVRLINKNTPKPGSDQVRRLPPTSPEVLTGTTSDPKPDYIGGVGIVEPVGEATVIGSQLPGVVEEICVKPGDTVEAGTPLLKLDRRAAVADLSVAQAELASQQAKLNELVAQKDTFRARLEAATALEEQTIASEANAKREYERAKSVRNSAALSEEEIDARRLNWELAQAKKNEARARVLEARAGLDLIAGQPIAASIEVQKAAVLQAEANTQRAQTNLDLRTIVAPKSGTILSVKIRVGEYVPATVVTTPFLTLGVIKPVHLRVDIDESEIPRFHPGSRAFASVRGLPETKVPIEYVRTEPLVVPKRTLTGTVSERVDTRVMQVIYSADPEALSAAVGQQVDVYIEEAKSAQTVP